MLHSRVTGVTDYTIEERALTLSCGTHSEYPRETHLPGLEAREGAVLTLRFLSPTVFRFGLCVNPETEADHSLPEYEESAVRSPVSLDTHEANGVLHVDTGALAVEVGLETWSFRVLRDGETVFETQADDVNVGGERRVEALEYTEERINHHPLRVDNVSMGFTLDPDEHIYGMGEQFGTFDRVGSEVEAWHVEPLGTETENAYKNVPVHLSTRGYGLLVDTTERVCYDVGHDSTASASVAVDGDELACYFFGGPTLPDAFEEYTALVGRPPRPPKWSFGVWMSRLGYESREELEAITDRLREEEIPADVVHLDPFWMRERYSTDLIWDEDQFPDPEGMIEGLHEKGFHLSLWEHPHIPAHTDTFAEASEAGYLIEDGRGKPYVLDRACQGTYRGGLVDFTNPDAAEWWKDKHRELLEMGVDTFKTDYGEYVPADAVLANGRSGASMHNVYPYLYNKAVYEAIEAVHGSAAAFVWARSAWTGSQRYPVHWGGDPQTSFSGMAAALRGGLSASISGFGFWSHDIGGFRGEPSRELYVRWSQFGLLSSHSRCHGTTPREPWAFGEEAVEIFKRYARLRYRLLPYMYSLAEETARTGTPVVRPLVLEYPDDRVAQRIDDQFLLGADVLVAPVMHTRAETEVYLPAGEWVDWWSGERHEGGRYLTRETPLSTMPVYVRAGSVLPTREPALSVQSGTPERLTLRTTARSTGPTNTSFEFYDESSVTFVTYRVGVENDHVTLSLPASSVETVVLVLDGIERPTSVVVNDTSTDDWNHEDETLTLVWPAEG